MLSHPKRIATVVVVYAVIQRNERCGKARMACVSLTHWTTYFEVAAQSVRVYFEVYRLTNVEVAYLLS